MRLSDKHHGNEKPSQGQIPGQDSGHWFFFTISTDRCSRSSTKWCGNPPIILDWFFRGCKKKPITRMAKVDMSRFHLLASIAFALDFARELGEWTRWNAMDLDRRDPVFGTVCLEEPRPVLDAATILLENSTIDRYQRIFVEESSWEWTVEYDEAHFMVMKLTKHSSTVICFR